MTIEQIIAQNLLPALILAGILGVYSQLRVLNGRMAKAEEWQTAHEKLDDERHAQHTTNIGHLSERHHALHLDVRELSSVMAFGAHRGAKE